MKKTQKHLDKIVAKTRLGRISLRQCRKAYRIAFKKEMPGDMAFVNALFLAAEKFGDDKLARIIRAIDRIDGDPALIAGWKN
jgi:hypothetical protein